MFARVVGILAGVALASELSLTAAGALPVRTPAASGDVTDVTNSQVAAAKKKKKAKPAVTVSSDTANTIKVSILPLLTGKKVWKFTVYQGRPATKKVKKGKKKVKVTYTKWYKFAKTKTVSPTQTRVVNMVPGTYRIYTPAQNKLAKSTTAAFAFPLAAPAPAPAPAPSNSTGTNSTTGGSSTGGSTTGGSTTGGATGGTGGGGSTGGGGTGGGGTATATVPTPPQSVSVTSGSQSVRIAWLAPASDGGSPITAYIAYTNGLQCYAFPPATSCEIGNLTNGISYRFYVVAQNSVGYSTPAAVGGSVVPAAAPGAPTGITGTPQQNGTSILVSWNPGSSGGSPINGYRATASPGGAFCDWTPATSCLINGLTTGLPYTFSVVARNDAGQSDPSVPSGPVTPALPPAAPTEVSAVKGAGQATVSWTAPTASGSPITRYTISAYSGGARVSTTVDPNAASPATIPGLTNGTAYTFTVMATNALGWNSPESVASAPVTPLSVPAAPSDAVASVTSGTPKRVKVVWEPSADSGGTPVTAYEVFQGNDLATPVCNVGPDVTQCYPTGLVTGNVYFFRVYARNAEGKSPASNLTLNVTAP